MGYVLIGSCVLLLISASIPTSSAASDEWLDLPRRLVQKVDPPGCSYQAKKYEHGEQVATPEPCLNCTCIRGVLVCYLRVCPIAVAPPPGCFPAREPDECCPTVICGINDLLPHGKPSNNSHEGEQLDESREHDLRPTFRPELSFTTVEEENNFTSAMQDDSSYHPISDQSSSKVAEVIVGTDGAFFATQPFQGEGGTSSPLQSAATESAAITETEKVKAGPYNTRHFVNNLFSTRSEPPATETSYDDIPRGKPSTGDALTGSAQQSHAFAATDVTVSVSRQDVTTSTYQTHSPFKEKTTGLFPETDFASAAYDETEAAEFHAKEFSTKSSRPENDSLLFVTSTAEEPITTVSWHDMSINDISAGCLVNGTIYGDGSAMMSNSFCEYCFCIRGKQTCLNPKCHLVIEGCEAIYDNEYSCCPSRYECSQTENDAQKKANGIYEFTGFPDAVEGITTTKRTDSEGYCEVERGIYSTGDVIPNYRKCHNCYCNNSKVLCSEIICSPALDGCTPIIPKGHCCPISYRCDASTNYMDENGVLSEDANQEHGKKGGIKGASKETVMTHKPPSFQRVKGRLPPPLQIHVNKFINGSSNQDPLAAKSTFFAYEEQNPSFQDVPFKKYLASSQRRADDASNSQYTKMPLYNRTHQVATLSIGQQYADSSYIGNETNVANVSETDSEVTFRKNHKTLSFQDMFTSVAALHGTNSEFEGSPTEASLPDLEKDDNKPVPSSVPFVPTTYLGLLSTKGSEIHTLSVHELLMHVLNNDLNLSSSAKTLTEAKDKIPQNEKTRNDSKGPYFDGIPQIRTDTYDIDDRDLEHPINQPLSTTTVAYETNKTERYQNTDEYSNSVTVTSPSSNSTYVRVREETASARENLHTVTEKVDMRIVRKPSLTNSSSLASVSAFEEHKPLMDSPLSRFNTTKDTQTAEVSFSDTVENAGKRNYTFDGSHTGNFVKEKDRRNEASVTAPISKEKPDTLMLSTVELSADVSPIKYTVEHKGTKYGWGYKTTLPKDFDEKTTQEESDLNLKTVDATYTLAEAHSSFYHGHRTTLGTERIVGETRTKPTPPVKFSHPPAEGTFVSTLSREIASEQSDKETGILVEQPQKETSLDFTTSIYTDSSFAVTDDYDAEKKYEDADYMAEGRDYEGRERFSGGSFPNNEASLKHSNFSDYNSQVVTENAAEPLAVNGSSRKQSKVSERTTESGGVIFLRPEFTDINIAGETSNSVAVKNDTSGHPKRKGARIEEENIETTSAVPSKNAFKIIPFVVEDAVKHLAFPTNQTLQTYEEKMHTTPDVISDFCFINGRLYVNGEMILKADPCELCRCFYGREMCQFQRCPDLPSPDCVPEYLPGFCCPRVTCGKSDPTLSAAAEVMDVPLQRIPVRTVAADNVRLPIRSPSKDKPGHSTLISSVSNSKPDPAVHHIRQGENHANEIRPQVQLDLPQRPKVEVPATTTATPLKFGVRVRPLPSANQFGSKKPAASTFAVTAATSALRTRITRSTAIETFPTPVVRSTTMPSTSQTAKTSQNTLWGTSPTKFVTVSPKLSETTSLRTTTTAKTTTTASYPEESKPLHSVFADPWGLLRVSGCNIYGKFYNLNEEVESLNTECKRCICAENGVECKETC